MKSLPPITVTVAFDPTSYTYSELTGNASLTIVRIAISTVSFTVEFSTTGDTAQGVYIGLKRLR